MKNDLLKNILNGLGMDGIVPALLPYRGNQKAGRNCGGIMPKNQLYLMYGRNCGKLHGDFLESGCKFSSLTSFHFLDWIMPNQIAITIFLMLLKFLHNYFHAKYLLFDGLSRQILLRYI